MAQQCFLETQFQSRLSFKEQEQGNTMSTEATPSTSPGFRVNGLEQQLNPNKNEKQKNKKTLVLEKRYDKPPPF